ncbi:MAG: DNA/RNA nuclease SfsA [Robiginitomaculum sp.]|nr:MAG: DNA/RNA nuclease SfsA [Robiginitomaculum sp.]
MKYDPPLLPGVLLKRYKRFLADIEMPDGTVITAHCANPGSMLGLAAPSNAVLLSDSQNPKRKLQMTLELIDLGTSWVGVNTHLANKLAEEAIRAGKILELTGYAHIRREVKYGKNSRIDFLLEEEGRPPCFVEVKSVTLSRTEGLAEFPDSVTKRGAKHLDELSDQVRAGARAVQLYVVQRSDCREVRPAQDIDPEYASKLTQANQAGVEVMAQVCHITPEEIRINHAIPVVLT